MEFDPQTARLRCPYCSTTTAIPDGAAAAPVVELDYEAFAAKAREAALSRISEQAVEAACACCGAVVQFEPPLVAGACAFCGAGIVSQPKSADPLVAPQAVLPFGIVKPQAAANVRQWLASRWFAPNDLKRLARPDGLDGVYLPFWTFDAVAGTNYIGQRGEHYWVEESYTAYEDGRQVSRTRQVRRTRWYPTAGSVRNEFDDLLVPGTRAVNRKRLLELEPWRLEALTAYQPSYLAGFKAQRYQVDIPDAFESAREMMTPAIRETVRADIGGDEQRIFHLSTRFSDVTFKHLLLPVWIGAYHYRGKLYQLVVNARTGEVQGERPYSAAKILLLAAAIIIAVIILSVISR